MNASKFNNDTKPSYPRRISGFAPESGMTSTNNIKKLLSTAVVLATALIAVPNGEPQAAPLNISDTPLFLSKGAEPLVMLALSNDEQLYHKAYTDFDDVDGDGLLDTTYKDTIAYFGYFDPKK